jgi:signal recognition particle subunit SRP54
MNMMEKMMSGNFNYNDLLKQMKMIKRMGKFSGILKMLPGMNQMADMDKIDDKQLVYIEAIVSSMTKEERKDPELLNRSSSRRNRVASGSGRSTTEVNRLISMLEKQTKMMRRMAGMNPSTLENMSQNVAQGTFQPKLSRAERRKRKK